MKQDTVRSFDGWLIGAGALVALLLVTVGLGFQNTRRLRAEMAWVTRSHQVMLELERMLSLVKDAEAGQRGYLITGEPAYLEPYTTAIAALGGQLDYVESLTADDPGHQSRFPALREHIAARLAIMEETVGLRRDGNPEAARRVVLSNRGKREMDKIRAAVAEMLQLEASLLQRRSAESELTYRTALASGVLSGAAAVAGVVAFVGLLRRHLATREAAAFVISEQRERLRTTLASIGDAVITTDTDGRVTNLNPVAERLTGWTSAAALGQPLESVFGIVNQDTRQPVDNPAARALREGVIVGLAQTVLTARDGSELPIDDSAAPIRGDDGERLGGVLIFRDVTERRRAEAALREADARKDEFLATLSHELRNPLAPLSNALSILKVAGDDPQAFARTRDMMERQLAQMVRLVDELIDVSRISRGILELRRGPVELASAVSHAVETCRPLAEFGRHDVVVRLPEEPVYLDADPVRLAQVFGNLLHNACKFTPPGGRIELAAQCRDRELTVSVSDDGVGIPPDKLASIFGMFSQVDKTRERSQGGLGIGLSLAKRLVELHGGTIEARSEGLGKGSQFVVRLPAVIDKPMPQPPGASTASLSAAPKRRVLVVDDNHDSADSLAALLSLGGHEAHTAHDGEHAISEAARLRPDVILLDIGLPRLNGYDTCKRIRALDWGRDMVIVALTGWGQDEDRRLSSEAGFDGHLVKPVDHAALGALLAGHGSTRG